MRPVAAAGALALAAFLAAGPAPAQTVLAPVPVPVGQAQGGNKALMVDWVRKKTQVRDQVLADLKRQGALPRDGQVSFEATVSPDPKNPGRSVVRIISLTITERSAASRPDPGARHPGPQARSGAQAAPDAPLVVRDTITIVSGRPQPQADGAAAPVKP